MKRTKSSKRKTIDEAILAILSNVEIEENKIFLSCKQLDRKQYLAVNEVLENMGGKWNRKSKSHIFTEDPTEKLECVLLTGKITLPKKYGYFPTPATISIKLIELAKIERGMSVLEPSAGQGGIADLIPKDCRIDCIELLSDNVAILEKKGYQAQQANFLAIEPSPIYHRVVMNPPFERQQDIDHVSHALKFLKPKGILVAIMSASILFRENKKTVEFRDLIHQHNGYTERLPEGCFKESGTGVNAVLVSMDI